MIALCSLVLLPALLGDPLPVGNSPANARSCERLHEQNRIKPDLIKIGERPNFEFHETVFNGPAVRTLADFVDKPLLVTFYSSRCDVCVGGAVPIALALQREYGQSFQVLFVETWAEPNETRAFALKRGWLGSEAMWTNEVPFQVPGRQVPTAVLLSANGTVVLSANPLAKKRELEQAIKCEVELCAGAPEGVPEALQPAWLQYRRGKIGRAIELAESQIESQDPSVAGAASAALKAFRERGSAQIAWIGRLVDTGHYVRAEALTATLRAGVRGDRELEQQLAEVSARLEAPQLKREREAAHALVEIENQMLLEGPGGKTMDQTMKRLDEFLTSFNGTKAALRARQLRDLATLH